MAHQAPEQFVDSRQKRSRRIRAVLVGVRALDGCETRRSACPAVVNQSGDERLPDGEKLDHE